MVYVPINRISGHNRTLGVSLKLTESTLFSITSYEKDAQRMTLLEGYDLTIKQPSPSLTVELGNHPNAAILAANDNVVSVAIPYEGVIRIWSRQGNEWREQPPWEEGHIATLTSLDFGTSMALGRAVVALDHPGNDQVYIAGISIPRGQAPLKVPPEKEALLGSASVFANNMLTLARPTKTGLVLHFFYENVQGCVAAACHSLKTLIPTPEFSYFELLGIEDGIIVVCRRSNRPQEAVVYLVVKDANSWHISDELSLADLRETRTGVFPYKGGVAASVEGGLRFYPQVMGKWFESRRLDGPDDPPISMACHKKTIAASLGTSILLFESSIY